MSTHPLAEVERDRTAAGVAYQEFLRVPAMSAGLYALPAGGVDGQRPHAEDEVYVVVAGRARVTVGESTSDVEPGTTVYVPAQVPHRFHDITEDLRLVVVFAPPESG